MKKNTKFFVFAFALGVVFIFPAWRKLLADEPTSQLVVPCRVVEVYDGDTVTVEVTLKARVRLLDCWAPEIRTRDDDEKARGMASKRFLDSIATGRSGRLVVPFEDASKLGDVFTFGRVLAFIFIDGESLSKRVVEAGHATPTKE